MNETSPNLPQEENWESLKIRRRIKIELDGLKKEFKTTSRQQVIERLIENHTMLKRLLGPSIHFQELQSRVMEKLDPDQKKKILKDMAEEIVRESNKLNRLSDNKTHKSI